MGLVVDPIHKPTVKRNICKEDIEESVDKMLSEDMDEMDDDIIFPITDLEHCEEHHDGEYEGSSDEDENGGGNVSGRYSKKKAKEFKPLVTRRAMRRFKLGLNNEGGNGLFPKLNLNFDKLSNVSPESSPSAGKMKWMKAIKKIKKMEDPWANFHIDNLPEERCLRHRYNALKQKWVQDNCRVKMETEPFNHGAMRACYRLKKLSEFSRHNNWQHAHNYVAKRYMETVARDVYFEDVRLQMDAKLWGEEYNRHRPPKQVDIFQMTIIEFVDRPDKPLYHLEHYIEGEYRKFNSNSGFVDTHHRFTPQAFSHFTFERSGHRLVVVDIQGVEDLWTDPQIHTADGTGYGDGNLGTKGMALFFHSHVCNSICHSLNLSTFDLTESELAAAQERNDGEEYPMSAQTRVKGEEEAVICASPTDRIDLTNFLYRSRSRNLSMSSQISDLSEEPEEDSGISQSMPEDSYMSGYRPGGAEPMSPATPDRVVATDLRRRLGVGAGGGTRRLRFVSESDDSSASTLTETTPGTGDQDNVEEEERSRFHNLATGAHRPACISHEKGLRTDNTNVTAPNMPEFPAGGDNVLGMIHHDLAKYHELGRFAKNENEVDWAAALFHEQHAADLGVQEAVLTLAKLHLGLQPDILINCTLDSSVSDNLDRGLDYMEQAARVGDRWAMHYLAQAYHAGDNLGTNRRKSYSAAVAWYERLVSLASEGDDSGMGSEDNTGGSGCGGVSTIDTPLYEIKGALADMYKEGGFGLDADPALAGDLYEEAAEDAMANMKGKKANLFYAQAEEARALVEEE